MRSVVIVVLVTAWAAPASAQTPQPAAPEFVASTYTAGNQGPSRVAVEPDGDFVVVWDSAGQDGSGYGVFARRFAADGTSRGAEFRVNTYTTGDQNFSAVAVGADGAFDVVWTSVQDGAGTSVQGQRYDGSGNPVGAEFQVNSYTTSFQSGPDVARAADGRFVVTWQSYHQDGDMFGLAARRFDAAGNPLGNDFVVNTFTTNWQLESHVASDVNGNFVVVWRDQAPGRDGSGWGVFGQRFDAAGNRLGGDFVVSTYTLGDQFSPSVSMSPLGGFVIAFGSRSGDGSLYAVMARRFDAAGTGVGNDFVVNTSWEGEQSGVRGMISHDAAGNFVVTWTSRPIFPPDSGNIFGQRFAASGDRIGSEFAVNAQTAGWQQMSTVGSDAAGNFVVTWLDRDDHDGSGHGVFARRFYATGMEPAALVVDPVAGPSSNGNGVQEPGEEVQLRPSWRNLTAAAQTITGALDRASGPIGAAYVITDALGDYGTIPAGATAPCADCYAFSVSDPAVRPLTHWDASVTETTSPVATEKGWFIHVGRSFTDVAVSSGFYRFIETLLHRDVTSGCGATTYCPDSSTTREQMAVFVLVAKEGAGYVPPACGAMPMFADVPASNPFCRWIEELARRAVVNGCGGGNYCPTAEVTREQMAVFVLRTLDPALIPPACTTPAYGDVPATSGFCPWIEELTRRAVVTGCGGGNYCPTAAVTREQMGVFISVTFGLTLYGP